MLNWRLTLISSLCLFTPYLAHSYPLPELYNPVQCKFEATQAKINPTRNSPIATAETPASIACVYGLAPYVPGCPIHRTRITPSGGWGIIAVTEGQHDPHAEEELAIFSAQYNLPPCTSTPSAPGELPCFSVVYATANGLKPTDAKDRDLREHALDIEMVHAMAPNAKIIMVEADSFNQPDIFNAVYCASKIVSENGGGIVSNSWSSSEYPTEQQNDFFFQKPGVVYTASSGDFLAPARYPSSSPYVISVGATQFVRDAQGNFVNEAMWYSPKSNKGTSGGPSKFVARPRFQDSVMKIVGAMRGTPDVSTIGANISFFHINESKVGIWASSDGTSFASPIMAGIINVANSRARSSQLELNIIYGGALKNYRAFWHDVLDGYNGHYALAGYDFVTGLGTPLGYQGK